MGNAEVEGRLQGDGAATRVAAASTTEFAVMAVDDTAAEEGVQPGRPLPRTWLLMGHKAGDNAQLLALAEALGFPFETRRLAYRRTELVTNLLAGPNLLGVVPERSDPLEPPWPELVLTAGRRNEPVARWIREQAGGSRWVKLVHVGRPWAPLPEFDLVVTTPQYSLPEAPNVLHNEVPLHRVTAGRLAAAREVWAPRLAHLPRPYVTVVLGGHSGPYAFDREAGALLGHHVGGMARELGGSLLVTTSARTPVEAVDALEARLGDVPRELFRWRRDAAENPYFGFLAVADRVVVTGRLFTRSYEHEGQRRSAMTLDAQTVAADLSRCTAVLNRTRRQDGAVAAEPPVADRSGDDTSRLVGAVPGGES